MTFDSLTATERELEEKQREIDDPLLEFNARFAVVKIGGKTRVVWFEDSPAYPGAKIPVFSTIPDFCSFHAKRRIAVPQADGTEKRIGIGRWWIDHEERTQYEGIVYAPNASEDETRGKLNLWTGFGVKAVDGECELYLDHLRDNICSDDSEHSEYLLNWMAYAVQFPERQGEVAVVMRGKEGVGKGVLAKEFGRLFGSHFRHIVHGNHLTGHFNAHLQQCSVLFADEAFFAGDRTHENVLKALITEETVLIEPKGVDSYSVNNCIHLMMSSNSDWVVPAGAEARRYFVVNVSDAEMQNHGYFAKITKQMENGGREALLFHLLNRDLSEFNVRKVPQTDALAEQKAHSRRGVDKLVEIIAHGGILPSAHGLHPDVAKTTGEERGEGFYCNARSLVSELKYDSPIVIGNKLKKDWSCQPWKSGNERGIKFPPLSELRALFDRRHGKQEWPELKDGEDWSM
jgi:Mesyanzhinovviridae DNA primase